MKECAWVLGLLTLTGGEGSWHGSPSLSVRLLGRRNGADGLDLGYRRACIWRADNDGGDGCMALRRQGVGAQAVERGERAGQVLVGGCWQSRSRELGLLSRDGGPQTKLELCLCGAEECLVHLGLVCVEGDVGCSRIRVALEHDMLVGLDLEDASKLQEACQSVYCSSPVVMMGLGCQLLIRGSCFWREPHLFGEHLRSEVLERQLELLALAAEQDLDHNGRVQRHRHVGGHGGRMRLTDAACPKGRLESSHCKLAAAEVNEGDGAAVQKGAEAGW